MGLQLTNQRYRDKPHNDVHLVVVVAAAAAVVVAAAAAAVAPAVVAPAVVVDGQVLPVVDVADLPAPQCKHVDKGLLHSCVFLDVSCGKKHHDGCHEQERWLQFQA